MTEEAGERRHWRVRRKRKGGRDPHLETAGGEAVETIGCCFFEFVAASALMLGLLVLPVWVWVV